MDLVTFGRDLDRLRSEMEELLSQRWRQRRPSGRRGFQPAVDVYHTDDPPLLTIVAELAGVEPGDVELSVAGGILTIAGTRRRLLPGQARYHQIELDWGAFERHIAVGEEVDTEQAEASLDRGLLTVRLPLIQRTPRSTRVLITVVRAS
jgi:HSP20 family protein